MARKHFSPSALLATETPSYIHTFCKEGSCNLALCKVALCNLALWNLALRKLLFASDSRAIGSAQVGPAQACSAQCVLRKLRCTIPHAAQAALLKAAARKLLSASCCAQTARHLSSNCSVHVALRKLLSATCSTLVPVHKMLCLRCAHTLRVLRNRRYKIPAGAAGGRSAYYVCTQKLRFSSRSCQALDRGIAEAGVQTARQLPKQFVGKKTARFTARAL